MRTRVSPAMHQQRLSGRSFGVVILAAGSTALEDLRLVSEQLRDAVAHVSAGQILHISRPPE